MKKLWVRITFSFLVLIVPVLLLIALIFVELLKDTYYDLKEEQLIQSATFINHMVKMNDEGLQEKIDSLAQLNDSRITVISKTGEVLAESQNDVNEMDSHKNREEVQQILKDHKKSGLSIRYSETLGYQMMYSTIPIIEDGELIGVIRSSMSLSEIDKAMKSIWQVLFWVVGSAILLIGLLSIKISRSISSPVEEMIEVSEKLTNGQYETTVKSRPKGELGQLVTSINILSTSLENQMKEIRENEQRLSGVLSNMMSGVLFIDEEGKLILANKAAANLLSLEPDQLIGKNYVEVSRNVTLSQLIEKSVSTGKEVSQEVQLLFPKERILDAHLAPYMDESGNLTGVIVVLHDMTAIRKLEKMRSEFVANVSHELKTPITSVKGFTETLLDGAIDDKEIARTFLEIIHKESERLDRLVHDILDLSTIEQQKNHQQLSKVDLSTLVHTAGEILKKKAKAKDIEIKLPSPTPVEINGVTDRIQQIILNLVANGIAYTGNGGTVEINILDHADTVDLIVRDTGIGIPSSELNRIFERFYRVDKARSRNSGGTGLGLAIVKHLVDLHDGTIQVNSEESQGTEFIISFPKG